MSNSKMVMDPDVAKSLGKTEVELEKTTMEELRKQMPKLIQLVYPERQAKYPKGRGKHIYEKPKVWPDEIPFHDPNNKRNGTRPMKHDVLAMFKHLIKLYKDKPQIKQEAVDHTHNKGGTNIMETLNVAQNGGMSQKQMYEESGVDELGHKSKYAPYLTQPRPEYSQDISIQPKVKPTNELGPKAIEVTDGNVSHMVEELKNMMASLPMLTKRWHSKIEKIQECSDLGIDLKSNELPGLALQVNQMKNLMTDLDNNINTMHTECLDKERELQNELNSFVNEMGTLLNEPIGDAEIECQTPPTCQSMETGHKALVQDTNATKQVMVADAQKLGLDKETKTMDDAVYYKIQLPEKMELENVDCGSANQINQTIDAAIDDFGCVGRQNNSRDVSVTTTIDVKQLETIGINFRPKKEPAQDVLTQKITMTPQHIINPNPKHVLVGNDQKMFVSSSTTSQSVTTDNNYNIEELLQMIAPSSDSTTPADFNSNATLSIPSKQLLPAPRNGTTQEQSQMVTSYSGRGKRSHTDTEAPSKVPKLKNEDFNISAECCANIPTFVQEAQAC